MRTIGYRGGNNENTACNDCNGDRQRADRLRYNTIVTQEQTVTAAWSEVLNQYQRRADLIPNIVETVKGEANFEQTTLQNVIKHALRRQRSRQLLNWSTIRRRLRSSRRHKAS